MPRSASAPKPTVFIVGNSFNVGIVIDESGKVTGFERTFVVEDKVANEWIRTLLTEAKYPMFDASRKA